MRIFYFKPNGGHSIKNVFIPIIREINKTNYVVETEMPSNNAGIKDIIQNGMSARRQQKKVLLTTLLVPIISFFYSLTVKGLLLLFMILCIILSCVV